MTDSHLKLGTLSLGIHHPPRYVIIDTRDGGHPLGNVAFDNRDEANDALELMRELKGDDLDEFWQNMARRRQARLSRGWPTDLDKRMKIREAFIRARLEIDAALELLDS